MSEGGLEQAVGFALVRFWLDWWWLAMAAGIALVVYLGHFESRVLEWRESRRLWTAFKELQAESNEDVRSRKLRELTPAPRSDIDSMRIRESIGICIALLAIVAFLLAAILQQLIYRY